MKITSYHPKYSKWIFIFLLIGVSFFYEYHKIMFLRPQSIHYWRQTDGTSITMNYYQNGMNLFTPQVHNLNCDDFSSGYSVGECPVYYYFIAALYSVFGPHDFIFRFMNTLIFFIGLFALFKLCENLLKDSFWAIAIAILIFTSPVIVYYANNFIMDSLALSFVFCGWYFFFKYYELKKIKYFYICLLLFLIAGLLKITAAMSVVALFALFFIEVFKVYKLHKDTPVFYSKGKSLLAFIIYSAAIIGWYFTAAIYNQKHGTTYFLMKTRPVWSANTKEVNDSINAILTRWGEDYFSTTVLLFFLFSLILLLLFSKKQNPFLYSIVLLLLAGSTLYSLLWFDLFRDHDYYIINLLILPVFILITLFYYLKRYKIIFKSVLIKILFTGFILSNIDYAREKLEIRYNSWMNNYPVFEDFASITPYLRSLGIERNDIVISLPDPTPSYTLYLMNQVGYTEFLGLNTDSSKISQSIERGAKYLLLTREAMDREYLKPFKKNRIGEYKSVSIFKLK